MSDYKLKPKHVKFWPVNSDQKWTLISFHICIFILLKPLKNKLLQKLNYFLIPLNAQPFSNRATGEEIHIQIYFWPKINILI